MVLFSCQAINQNLIFAPLTRPTKPKVLIDGAIPHNTEYCPTMINSDDLPCVRTHSLPLVDLHN